MIPQPLPQSPAYQEVVRGLVRMHKYTVDGQDECEEADELRESMGEPWGRLSSTERDRVAGLSKDLYTVSDPPSPGPEPMNPQAQARLTEAFEARGRGEWDRALELLRRWGKYLEPPLLSYLRGRIWEDAGDRPVSVLFFDHACRLAPQDENFQAARLNVLKWTDFARAMAIAEPVLNESQKHIPNLVIQAAEVLHAVAVRMPQESAAPIYRRLIGVLMPLLSRSRDEEGLEHPTQLSMIYLLLAIFHRWLGQIPQAYDYYSRAIQLEPWNDALFISRGIIAYGTNPLAVSDFERAIRLKSQFVWPYYFMAHYYVSNGRMEECRQMCERALGMSSSPRLRSELCEFRAIALAGLDYPEAIVRQAFEEAIRTDPSNERAARNLQRYLDALAAPPPRAVDWDRPSDSDVRTSGHNVGMMPELYQDTLVGA
jgi:tetratricopeptide (TPR) repeat protein